MINPDSLTDAIATKLKAITALTALIDADNIAAYGDTESSLTEAAFHSMPKPSILVAHVETTEGADRGPYIHRFRIIVRPPGRFGAIFNQIVNGVPTGETLAMQYVEFHSSCDPLNFTRGGRIEDEDGIEVFDIDAEAHERWNT